MFDGLLQHHQALHQRFGPGRATGDVHVHGNKLVHALYHAVDIVHAAGVGTGAHGDNPARLQQLVVKVLHHRRHLAKHGAGNDHEVGLARGGANDFRAESRDVVAAGKGGGHLYITARQSEIERPQRMGTTPGDQVFQPGEEYVAPHLFLNAVPGTARSGTGYYVAGFAQAPLHQRCTSGCGVSCGLPVRVLRPQSSAPVLSS